MTLMDGYTRVRLTPEIAGRPGAGGPDDWESVSAPMAPSFFPRRVCRPTCRAHRARGGWNHSRRCPRDTRPPEPLHCPVDICPVDIFEQRQHVWIARPTLKAIDKEQSLAAVHHCSLSGSYLRVCPPLRPYFPLSWHDV